MCELCNGWICPPRCPNYEENAAVRCMCCGARLDDGDPCYVSNGKPYCVSCVEEADVEELVRICETETEELYGKLGLTRGAFDSSRGAYGR